MKPVCLIVCALLSFLANAPRIYAQYQRLSIVPQKFNLQGKGQTFEAEAFCLDRHIYAPSKPTPYGEVLTSSASARVRVGNKPPISLQEAINRRVISVTGQGGRGEKFGTRLSLQFTSNEDASVTIEVISPVAMGERPGRVNPAILDPLRRPLSPGDSKAIQDVVWKLGTNERLLQVLGFYFGRSDEVNPLKIKAATMAFQERQRLPPNGILNLATIRALEKAEELMKAKLERLGFKKVRTDTTVQDLSDSIREYQLHLGQPETGLLNPSLLAQVERDESYLRQVLSAEETHLNPATYLKSSTFGNSEVMTFQNYGRVSAVIVKTPRGPELWLMIDSQVRSRQAGKEAIEEFDYLSLATASKFSAPQTSIVQTGIYRPEAKILVALGPQKLFAVEPGEILRFISGESSIPAFDKYIASLSGTGTKKPKLIVTRSAINHGRGGDAGNGTSPLEGLGYSQFDPMDIAIALHRLYGYKVEVFLANDINLGLTNASSLPAFKKGSQMRVYIDEKITDYGTIEHVKKDLERTGIKIVKAADSATGQPNVVLFAGHNDVEFRNLVEQLTEQGHFKDSLIALATCGAGCEVAFNSMIIRKSGAKAVLFYNRKINAQAVEDVLLKFSDIIVKEGVPDSQFQEVWRRSIDEVLKTCRANECDEVKQLRDVLIQVSFMPTDSHESSVRNAE